MPLTFAHIINPYWAETGSHAARIQEVTLHALADARKAARNCRVELLAAQLADDHFTTPDGCRATPHLERSVCDLHSFSTQQKYPLIADILKRAFDASDAEFIVYTNMDIVVQPYFYDGLVQLLRDGADALIINRRRIPDTGQTAADLPLVLAEVGRSHPGFDCFVMHRSLVPKLLLDGVCVGVPFLEASLLYNLLAFSKDCRIMEHLHLTTHLGLEVMPARDAEYHRYNQERFNAILPNLKPHLVGKKLPYSELGFFERTLKRGLNPSVFTGLHLELESKGLLMRMRSYWNELRFRLLAR